VVMFSFVTAPLYARFRDMSMIWEVFLSVIMYASPIIYPLTLMSQKIQKILLLNPVAFIIYFGKQGLIYDHFTNRSTNGGICTPAHSRIRGFGIFI
jgi:ABC-type polysaccharide/polyol phosphate export permease